MSQIDSMDLPGVLVRHPRNLEPSMPLMEKLLAAMKEHCVTVLKLGDFFFSLVQA